VPTITDQAVKVQVLQALGVRNPEDEGIMLLIKVCGYLPVDTKQVTRKI
jgi:hypothetical protein